MFITLALILFVDICTFLILFGLFLGCLLGEHPSSRHEYYEKNFDLKTRIKTLKNLLIKNGVIIIINLILLAIFQ